MILVVAMLSIPVAAAAPVPHSFRAPILIAVAEVATLAGIIVTLTPAVAASGWILLLAIGSFVALGLLDRYASLGPA